jgi:hypothetical protein
MSETCAYCNLPSFTGNVTNPVLCHKHLDLLLLILRLTRNGTPASRENVNRAYLNLTAEIRNSFSFTRAEIRTLMAQMRERGYEFPNHSNKHMKTPVKVSLKVGRRSAARGAIHGNCD